MQEKINEIIERIKDRGYSIIGADLFLTDHKVIFKFTDGAKFSHIFHDKDVRKIAAEATQRVWSKAIETAEFELIEKACALAPAPEKCKTCDGSGYIHLCAACNGDGECYCIHCDQYYKCKICDGSGRNKADKTGERVECDNCAGSGLNEQFVKIVGRSFCLNRLRLIADVAPGAVIFRPLQDQPAYFKNGEISGLIMPCNV